MTNCSAYIQLDGTKCTCRISTAGPICGVAIINEHQKGKILRDDVRSDMPYSLHSFWQRQPLIPYNEMFFPDNIFLDCQMSKHRTFTKIAPCITTMQALERCQLLWCVKLANQQQGSTNWQVNELATTGQCVKASTEGEELQFLKISSRSISIQRLVHNF